MAQQTGALRVPLTAVTTTAAGGALKLANPFDADVIITRFVLDVETQSTGAATLDVGVHATGAASADNLIDGQSVAAAGVFDNVGAGGTNGKAVVVWGKTAFVVATASATLAGLKGHAHIEVIYR